MGEEQVILLPEALRAQQALRRAAGLPDEHFPLAAFVGMVSDEVEALRGRGKTDEDIARMVEESSGIRITAEEIGRHYAPPESREWGER